MQEEHVAYFPVQVARLNSVLAPDPLADLDVIQMRLTWKGRQAGFHWVEGVEFDHRRVEIARYMSCEERMNSVTSLYLADNRY